MDENEIPKLECSEREPDSGTLLSFADPETWPALVLLREIETLSAAGQKQPRPNPREPMELTDQIAPESPPTSQSAPAEGHIGEPAAGPEAAAQPEAASPATGGPPPVAPAAEAAVNAWTNVAVRANRGRYPASLRAMAEQMLIEGASPEEVVQAAHDRGFERLKRDTVQRWQDENPQLSEQALRRQAETADVLRRSLAAGVGSPEARLAEAALFAGLSRPRKRGSLFAAAGQAALDVITRRQLESENRVLRRQAEHLEQRKRTITRRIIRARLRLERMRWSLLERQVSRLYTVTESDLGDDLLVPELLKQLRKLRRMTRGRRKKAAGPNAT